MFSQGDALRRLVNAIYAGFLICAGLAVPLANASEPVVLKFEGVPPLSSELAQFVQAYYPDIKVEFIPKPSGSFTMKQLADRYNAGEYDLSYVTIQQMQLMFANGYEVFAPLDEHIARDEFDMAPFKELRSRMQAAGQTYLMPLDARPTLVSYNKRLFDQFCLPYPDPDWTWDDFRELALVLDEAKAKQAVILYPTMLYFMLLESQGDILATTPESIVKAVTWFADMLKDQTVRVGFFDSMFTRGESPIMIQQYSDMRFFDWIGRVPIPGLSETERMTPAQVYGIVVPKTSKHPEEAWKVAQLLTGPEGAAFFTRRGYLTGYRTPDIEKLLTVMVGNPGTAKLLSSLRLAVLDGDMTSKEHYLFGITVSQQQRLLIEGRVTLGQAIEAILERQKQLLDQAQETTP